MSTEEIVARIQDGEDLWNELWGQVEKFVKWRVNHVLIALDGASGIEFGDLYNTGYLALVDAVQTYTQQNSSFVTWFMFYLKTAFAEATGYRTKRSRNDPLRNAISLSSPVGDEPDDGTLSDIVPDPCGHTALESVENDLWNKQLHEVLECALQEIPAEQRDILLRKYYDGQTRTAIAHELGITMWEARKRENNGLKSLRHPLTVRKIQPFYQFDFYSGAGLGKFKNSDLSVQERYLIMQEKQI